MDLEAQEAKFYVAHICSSCDSIFMDIDDCLSQIIPPDYKQCEKCEPNRKKAINKELKNIYKRKDNVFNHVCNNIPKDRTEYEQFIIEKCLELISKREEKNQKITTRGIFNEVLEILNYYIEDGLTPEQISKKFIIK